MPVHADAVAQAVGKVLEARAKPGVADHLARGSIHLLGGQAGTSHVQRGFLGGVNHVEDLFHLVAGFAEYERARDVGAVALDVAAVVDHDRRAFLDHLRRGRSVR